MKRFICLMIFAIGIMVSLPGQSSGSGSPPDQTCFVVDHPVVVTAMVVNQDMVANYELTFAGYHPLAMAVLPQEGGEVAGLLDQERTYLIKSLVVTSQNNYLLSPNFYVLSNFRTCRYKLHAVNRKSKEKDTAYGLIRIRADSKI